MLLSDGHRLSRFVVAIAGLTLAVGIVERAAAVTATPPSAGLQPAAKDYFRHTSQLDQPLRPLAHLPPNANVEIRAAVVSLPDPVETRLARAFDIELAALISAFQAQGYVLDGYAFSWIPRAPGNEKAGDTTKPGDTHRDTPSVIVFRRDAWRSQAAAATSSSYAGAPTSGGDYYALFLVGETPWTGVHPTAFVHAAACAIAMDDRNHPLGNGGLTGPGDDCDRWMESIPSQLQSVQEQCTPVLDVIGPSFSGAMQSVAAALDDPRLGGSCSYPARDPGLHVELLSPSASVGSNDRIALHPFFTPGRVTIQYAPLARSVESQFQQLLSDVHARFGAEERIVVLAEQSEFGGGAIQAATSQASDPKLQMRVHTVQFPPNIAAIRAEHAKLERRAEEGRPELLPSRLLELDLEETSDGIDLPPVYLPSLASRSDELMLYQTLDAIGLWVRPTVVVIVATDVRDRLFLLSQVRDTMPGVLPVVLEQDNLLVHPDYREISRGSVIVGAGKTLVCLGPRGIGDDGRRVVECGPAKGGSPPSYYSFATDYAANMFRAGNRLITLDTSVGVDEVPLLVATLAGFQSVNPLDEHTNVLINAGPRMQLRLPVYLGLCAMALGFLWLGAWLLRDLQDGRIMRVLPRFPFYALSRATSTGGPDESLGLPLPGPVILVIASAAAAVIAGLRSAEISYCPLPTDACPFLPGDPLSLAHGRDFFALVCLALVFLCIASVATMRFEVWRRHFNGCTTDLASGDDAAPIQIGESGYLVAGLSAVVVALALRFFSYEGPNRSVDLAEASMLFYGAALMAGAFFFTLTYFGLRRWRDLTLFLARTAQTVNEQKGFGAWPSSSLVDEHTRSPFNLDVRELDLRSLGQAKQDAWAVQTCALRAGIWPFPGLADFRLWQARLVTEMKLAATAVRSAAWCSALAPAVALAMMQVFPPVYGRLQILAAIILLAASFAGIIYATLRLETDYLLGRMFTGSKDDLTFRGALVAVAPKALALATILASVFLPNAWGWLHGIASTVGSLH